MTQKKLLSLLLPGLVLLFLATRAFSGGAVSAQTPADTPTPGPVAVTVTFAQGAVSCGTSISANVSVTVGSAAAPNGTQVALTANIGTVPPAVTTTNGQAVFNYIAPATGGGTARVSATALGVTGAALVNVICGTSGTVGAVLGTPAVACAGSTANVVFSWTPVAGAEVQWVDLSLSNNGFAPGTFIGFGPLSGTTTQIQWNGLIAGQTHYWRVNAGTSLGWIPSQTGSFTPCAPTIPPNTVTYVCTGSGRATVFWNLSQPPVATSSSWLDLSIFDNGFLPGTFIGGNITGQTQHTWPGILANVGHFWRVNDLTPQGWIARSTGSFNAIC